VRIEETQPCLGKGGHLLGMLPHSRRCMPDCAVPGEDWREISHSVADQREDDEEHQLDSGSTTVGPVSIRCTGFTLISSRNLFNINKVDLDAPASLAFHHGVCASRVESPRCWQGAGGRRQEGRRAGGQTLQANRRAGSLLQRIPMEEEERGLIKDLERHAQLAAAHPM
jgi:hypothetical protein